MIEYDLSTRQKAQLHRKRPNVLLAEKTGSLSLLNKPRGTNYVEMVSDMDDDEDDEEEEGELEGDDVMSDAEKKEPTLPRAANGKVKTSRGRNERVITPKNAELIYGGYSSTSPSCAGWSSGDMALSHFFPLIKFPSRRQTCFS